MKTQTINQDTLTKALPVAGGVAAGAFLSRIADDKTKGLIKSNPFRQSIIMAVGVLGAAAIKGNDTTSSAVQGACLGMASTQFLNLLKSFFKPTEGGILATGMGSAENPIVIYDSNFGMNGTCNCSTGLNAYEEVSEITETNFLANPEEQFQLV